MVRAASSDTSDVKSKLKDAELLKTDCFVGGEWSGAESGETMPVRPFVSPDSQLKGLNCKALESLLPVHGVLKSGRMDIPIHTTSACAKNGSSNGSQHWTLQSMLNALRPTSLHNLHLEIFL